MTQSTLNESGLTPAPTRKVLRHLSTNVRACPAWCRGSGSCSGNSSGEFTLVLLDRRAAQTCVDVVGIQPRSDALLLRCRHQEGRVLAGICSISNGTVAIHRAQNCFVWNLLRTVALKLLITVIGGTRSRKSCGK